MLTAAVVRLTFCLHVYCCIIRDADTLIYQHIPYLVWTKLETIGSRLFTRCPVYRPHSIAVQHYGQCGSASASCDSLRAQTAHLALRPPRRHPGRMPARPQCRPGPSSLWSQSWAATLDTVRQQEHALDRDSTARCYMLLAPRDDSTHAAELC